LDVLYVRHENRPAPKRRTEYLLYLHAAHSKPQGIYNSIKYDPLNVGPEGSKGGERTCKSSVNSRDQVLALGTVISFVKDNFANLAGKV
jgi:hypothetical protein